MTHEHASKSIRMLSLVMLGMLLAALLLPGWAQASPLQLPPRPPTPTAEPVSGGLWGAIQLQAVQPQMNAWIVVEWQDAQGGWHTVIGWQGGFDSISNGIGLKTWWVAPADWGKGPFRWQVYRSKGGKVLATSAPFDLPTRNRAIVKVGLAVAP
jgi:hypothetical protein